MKCMHVTCSSKGYEGVYGLFIKCYCFILTHFIIKIISTTVADSLHRCHLIKQEAQLMLTTGSTHLLAVSRAHAISDGTLT